MSDGDLALTSAGPMWSTKHHDPTVRRPRLGSARLTRNAPTSASRLSVSSTGPASGSLASTAATSSTETGPLIASFYPTDESSTLSCEVRLV